MSFNKALTPPVAETRPVSITTHGIERIDNYAWLRAENWQEVMRDPDRLAADIRAYLEAENTYQAALMADTTDLQETLYEEMKGRIKQDDSSVPMKDGPWAYGISYVEGGEQPRLFRIPSEGGDQQIMLDGDREAKDSAYFKMGGSGHSPDHSTLFWSFDGKGSEYFSARFRDLQTGTELDDRLEDTGGGGSWSTDGSHFIYGLLDKNHRPSKIFAHRMGTDQKDDRLIFEEKDPGFFMGVGKTQSETLMVIDIHDHQTSEAWLLPANDPLATPKLVAQRETGIEYSIDEANGTLYILTNRDSCKDFKIVSAPIDQPETEHWVDLVPHKPGRMIISHCAFKDFLVWMEREDGLPRIIIHRFSDGQQHAIAFDEEAYSLGLIGAYEFDTDTIRFSYSSMTTPSQTFDYNMNTRERVLLKTQEVPSGHAPQSYVTKRIQAPTEDGQTVPISLLYHKNTPLDGSAPCLLYGYGSYGMTIPAGFNTNCLSLVDRGFIYAIAHIRGGKDKGFAWYEDGKRQRKKNTFKDFIAAGHHLVTQGYTSNGQIVGQGGSAGGMLMGAVANMAPELFAGIIAEVPFVDVLNTMLDDTLPLTPPEWPEWGNPITSEEDYAYIASYSPYENSMIQSYPPIFAIAGLTDPRVTYWEPAKWIARLRELNQADSIFMLKTNMEAGHGGASGRFRRLEEIATNYAFALKTVGLTK